MKDDDWLQTRAAEIALENEGESYISRVMLLELLVISDRFEFDRTEALTRALEIAAVPEDVLFQAADYMAQDDLTAFGAHHIAYAGEDPLISSDNAFDDIADRITIEENGSE